MDEKWVVGKFVVIVASCLGFLLLAGPVVRIPVYPGVSQVTYALGPGVEAGLRPGVRGYRA
ncbi:hypothetical protein GOAMR_59_00390 [Gordonia amarae NBRC 15530]|uniref:Uncharacterized protein n=1 Tax=Gordonia amarae NBRC 15530 TaxID=1075090 RepID=G7GT14_9ACTN|nr:hypothetical protein GOAMR_59_00390 [Gordonia amarae NBRC 15530]